MQASTSRRQPIVKVSLYNSFSLRGSLDGGVDSLLFAQHALEMFRRSLPHRLDELANRLTEIIGETRKLEPDR